MPSLHRHTPALTALDPRGAPVRTVAYHRLRAEDEPVARITRSVYGATGFLQQQWDPRLQALQATDAEVKPTVSHCYSLTGQVLRTDSVDAGWRVMLLGGAGQPVRSWDANGARQRHDYDRLLRPVAVFEQAQDDPVERCVERLTYAAATPGQAANNCSGRLVRHEDPAGSVRIEHYSLTGAVTGQSRRFAEPGARIDWPARKSDREALLQAENFTSTGRYNALGAVLEQVDAKGHRRFFDYGVSGELTGTQLQFSGGQRKVLMHRRRYNAHGQVIAESAGNGLLTQARYDEADGRLQQWVVYQSANKARVLQDLTYAYDRVGNVTRVEDAAQPTVWASNARIEAVSHYAYDTLYQLIKATGREQAQHTGGSALPGLVLFGSAQATLWRNYSRHYQYDAAGNLLQMQHVPSIGQGYTQRMRVAARSNHSQPEALGITPGPGSGFDRCGNQQALARGQMMSWNARNQLVHVTQVMREDGDPDEESYGYDAAGQRVFKWRSSKAKGLSHRREVRYLPGLELHRDEATGQWLNVLSVEAGHTTVRALQWERGLPAQAANEQLRYGLSDLTGSCTLELDAQAALLSQEGYYPYGATAWWAARSALEASYKTVRYSGKERDATGLYYYGFRYYAPWLHRWISPDPAGGADGLNRFAMVKGNPITYVDSQGTNATPAETVKATAASVVRDAVATTQGATARYYTMTMLASLPVNNVTITATSLAGMVLGSASLGYVGAGLGAQWVKSSRYGDSPLAKKLGAIAGGTLGAVVGILPSALGWISAINSLATDQPTPNTAALGQIGATASAVLREPAQRALAAIGPSITWNERPQISAVAAAGGLYGGVLAGIGVGEHLIANPVARSIVPSVAAEAVDALGGTVVRALHQATTYNPGTNTFVNPLAKSELRGTTHGILTRMAGSSVVAVLGLGIEAAGVDSTSTVGRSTRKALNAVTEARTLVGSYALDGYNSQGSADINDDPATLRARSQWVVSHDNRTIQGRKFRQQPF